MVLWSSMIRFLQAYAVPTIVVASPFRRSTAELDSFYASRFSNVSIADRVIASMDRVNDMIVDAVQGLDVPIIDSRELAPTRGNNATAFYDILHLNSTGHAEYGAALGGALLPLLMKDNFSSSANSRL